MNLPWRPVGVDGGRSIGTSLTENEAQTLRELATGRRVLEVGSAYGYSAVVMAKTALHVTAVDPHEDWLPAVPEHNGRDSLGEMRANLDAYGVEDKVEIVCDFSQNVLPELYEQGERFDLIFIDGDHAESSVIHDTRWALKLLNPSGILACHDYDEGTCRGVRPALDRLRQPDRLVDTLWIARKEN